jgi:hypothetical protein
MELAVTAGLSNEPPAIRLEELDHGADLYGRNLTPSSGRRGRTSKAVDIEWDYPSASVKEVQRSSPSGEMKAQEDRSGNDLC